MLNINMWHGTLFRFSFGGKKGKTSNQKQPHKHDAATAMFSGGDTMFSFHSPFPALVVQLEVRRQHALNFLERSGPGGFLSVRVCVGGPW